MPRNNLNKPREPFILVIEDEYSFSLILKRVLDKEDYVSNIVNSGDEALEFLRTSQPDLMIIDYVLRDMNAQELVEKMYYRNLRIPFIIITAYGNEQIAVELMKLGAKDYIVKDNHFSNLLPAVVRNVLEQIEIEKKLFDTESSLTSSREEFYSLFDNSLNAIYITKENGDFKNVNKSFLNFFGYNKSELADLNSVELFNNKLDRARLIRNIQKEGSVSYFKTRLRKKSGEISDCFINATPYYNAKGDLVGYQAIIQPVPQQLIQSQTRKNGRLSITPEILQRNLITIAESINDMLIVIDYSGKILFCNSIASLRLGFNPNELSKMFLHEIHPEEHFQKINEIIEQAIIGSIGISVLPMLTKTGELLAVETNINSGFWDNSDALVLTSRDITPRIFADKKISDTSKMTAEIVREIPAGLFIYKYELGDRLILVDGNPEAEKLTGINVENCIGLEFDDIWSNAGDLKKIYINVARTGESLDLDEFKYSSDKLDGYYRIKAFNLSGDLVAVAFEDTTNAKKAEKALLESEKLHRSIITNAFDAVFIVRGKKYQFINNRFAEITGYQEAEVLHGEFDFSKLATDNSKDIIEDRYRKRIAGIAIPPEYEIEIRKKSGEIAIVHVSTSLLSEGKEPLVIGIIRDITESVRAQKQISDNEELFRTLFESSPDAIFINDGNFILNCNNKALSLFGMTKSMLIGSDFAELSPEIQSDNSYSANLAQNHIRKAASGEPVKYEWNFKKLDGTEFPAEVTLTKLKLRKGLITQKLLSFNDYEKDYLQYIIRDISSRMRTRKALEESEAKYRLLVENSSEAIVVVQGNQIKYFNQRFANLFSYVKEGVSFDLILTSFLPDDRELIKKRYESRIGGKKVPNNYSVRFKDDNSIIRTLNLNSILIDWEGSPAVLTFLSDLTDKLAVEQKLQLFIDSVKDMVYFQSLDGRIIMYNSVFREISGYTEDEIFNQPNIFKNIIDSNNPLSVQRVLADFPEDEDYIEHEYKLKTKSGEIKWLLSRKVAVRNTDGEITGFNCIDRDITELKNVNSRFKKLNKELETRVLERTAQLEKILEDLQSEIIVRKKTEEELNQTKEEISRALAQEKELSELKSRFISMISHEYRTPLTVILTSTYLLEQLYKTRDDASFTRHLDKIRISVKSMTKLLEDVLTIGREDTGKSIVHPATVDLIHIGSELIDEIRYIDKNQHEILFEHDIDFCFVHSDEKFLRQIISNLMNNAVKYSPSQSKIILEIKETPRHITISVFDQGIGISDDDMEFLFEPFHRGINVGTISGTGLGLSIVKRCVEILKGSIKVRSNPGSGTTFSVTLPKDSFGKQIES